MTRPPDAVSNYGGQHMEDERYFLESDHYRMLDYRRHHHQSEDLYLLMCGLEQCLPGKQYGPNRRPGYHLHVILSGEGLFEAGGSRIALHSGQIFLEKPDELTWYAASQEKPWTYCWVTFDGRRAPYYMEQAGFTRDVHALNSYVPLDGFFHLTKELLNKPELNLANDLRRQGLLNQFISLAIESDSCSRHGKRNTGYSPNSYVDYALDFIHNNFDRIRVSDISSFIGIDRSYFTNIFTRRVGVSPQKYLLYIRMRHSSELLLSTDQSIQEVAREAGYSNALTFSKTFKAFYGVSPRHYRIQPEQERVYLPEISLPWRNNTR